MAGDVRWVGSVLPCGEGLGGHWLIGHWSCNRQSQAVTPAPKDLGLYPIPPLLKVNAGLQRSHCRADTLYFYQLKVSNDLKTQEGPSALLDDPDGGGPTNSNLPACLTGTWVGGCDKDYIREHAEELRKLGGLRNGLSTEPR